MDDLIISGHRLAFRISPRRVRVLDTHGREVTVARNNAALALSDKVRTAPTAMAVDLLAAEALRTTLNA